MQKHSSLPRLNLGQHCLLLDEAELLPNGPWASLANAVDATMHAATSGLKRLFSFISRRRRLSTPARENLQCANQMFEQAEAVGR
jgi:hypothetical protein